MTPSDLNDDPLLHAEAAAAYLGLIGVVKHPGAAVRALARKRRLPSIVVCNKIMFRRSALEAFIRENTREKRARDV